MAAPSYVYDVIRGDDWRWGADQPLGTAVTISYSFATSTPSYWPYNAGFTPFNATEMAAVHKALDYIESFTKITFVETSGNSGQLQFGNNDYSAQGVGGAGPTQWTNGVGYTDGYVTLNNSGSNPLSGNAFIPGEISYDDPNGEAWQTLLHEIGHTLGLKHTQEANAAGDPQSVMPPELDDRAHSIMSYNNPANSTVVAYDDNGASRTGALGLSTYAIYDIAALQYLYGADTPSASGGVYVFEPDQPVYTTIIDGGTIDVQALTGTNRIDITPGAWSHLSNQQVLPSGDVPANAYDGEFSLGVAYGAKVTDVYGGSGVDVIIGNDELNALDGNGGADTILGGGGRDTISGGGQVDLLYGQGGADDLDGDAGADVMVGGDGDDVFHVDDLQDAVREKTNGGHDTVYSSADISVAGQAVEDVFLTGSANVDATGGKIANHIVGNDGANALNGSMGDDTISGGLGADSLTGGKGSNLFVFDHLDAVDHVTDFHHVSDHIELDHAVFTQLTLGTLSKAQFRDLATGAEDADDRILYDKATGGLFYDHDGAGGDAAIKFATIDTHASLDRGDFLVA